MVENCKVWINWISNCILYFWITSAPFVWRGCSSTGKTDILEGPRYVSVSSSWLCVAIGRFRQRYWYSRKEFYNQFSNQFWNFLNTLNTLFKKSKRNSLRAWTIKTSTDSVRMSVAWAQLIHIILVTFLAGNSLIGQVYLLKFNTISIISTWEVYTGTASCTHNSALIGWVV